MFTFQMRVGKILSRGENFILELDMSHRPGDWHSLLFLSLFSMGLWQGRFPEACLWPGHGHVPLPRGCQRQASDRCARGHGQEFPACLRCHSCFDQWDHTVSSLSEAVQGLIRLAANLGDKRETLPVCEADFKGLRENMSKIERIWRHPVFSSGEFLKVKDYHASVW